MKKIIRLITLAALMLFSTQAVMAQRTGSVTAAIFDSDNTTPMISAMVELVSLTDSTRTFAGITDIKGNITINNVGFDKYKIIVSYLGYEDYNNKTEVNARNINLGNLFMHKSAFQIEGVEVVGRAIRTSLSGDTTVYNADAFKTGEDADADKLIEKLPGIEIDPDTKEITARGKTVQKILWDGRELFGNDVSAAMSNIPANMIKNVEVFEKKSDAAEISGVEDGEGYQVINFVTSGTNDFRTGRIEGGYFFNDKYSAQANLSLNTGSSRFTINGGTNNVGAQAFDEHGEDGAMIRGGSNGGLSTPSRGMFSYSLDKKYDEFQQLKISASYTLTHTKRENIRDSYNEDYSQGLYPDKYTLGNSYYTGDNRTTQHRLNTRMEYRINEVQKFSFNAGANINKRNTENVTIGDDFSFESGLMTLIDQFRTVNSSTNDSYGYNGSLDYNVRLGKPGRTITAAVGGNYNKTDGESGLWQRYWNDDLTISFKDNDNTIDNNSHSVNGSISFQEPLSEHLQLTSSYRLNYSKSHSETLSEIWDDNLHEFVFSGDDSRFNENKTLRNSASLGFNWHRNRDYVRLDAYYNNDKSDIMYVYPTAKSYDGSFNSFNINFRGRKTFSPSETFEYGASARQNNPSVEQLQGELDETNLRRITVGNPNLDKYMSYSANIRYNWTGVKKGNSFFLDANYNVSSSSIRNYTIVAYDQPVEVEEYGITLQPGAQFSRPVNMPMNWNARVSANYAFPLPFIKCNFNVRGQFGYNEASNYINEKLVWQGTENYSFRMNLSSNISDKIDFSLRYMPNFSIAHNSDYVDTKNFRQMLSAYFYIRTWGDLVFSGECNYMHNRYITQKTTTEHTICNFYIGKKFFKAMGEIAFGVNDAFNNTSNVREQLSELGYSRTYNNSIGRFWGFRVTYKIRHFGQSNNAGNSARGGRQFPGGDGSRMPGMGGGGRGGNFGGGSRMM